MEEDVQEGAVVVEDSEDGPPTLLPQAAFDASESLTPMPIPVYDPDLESEDDVPTTLYRHQDEDLEALLGELDTGDHHR